METEEKQSFDPASFAHVPVLLEECLEGLAIDPAGIYLDGTAGGQDIPARSLCVWMEHKAGA